MGNTLLANNTELGILGLNSIYTRGIREIPKFYPEIFNVKDSNVAVEKDFVIQGQGYIPVLSEGAAITTISVNKDGTKNYNSVTRTANLQISDDLIRFDQYGAIEELTGEFARSFVATMDYAAHDILNNITSTAAAYVMRDGLALASIAHVMGDGSTNRNRPDTFMTFTRANVETALSDIYAWKNDGSRPMLYEPYAIYCHRSKKMKANEILKSLYYPGEVSATKRNIAINSLNELGLKVIATPYLSNTLAWGVLMGPAKSRSLKMFVADYPKELKVESQVDSLSKFYNTVLRMSAGATDWTSIYCGYTA